MNLRRIGHRALMTGLRRELDVACRVAFASQEWEESPMKGVLRRRLHLSGTKEAGIVTSFVQYLPGSSFREHPHPNGEEIFVLEGVFSDHTGDWKAGSYLCNPEGFEHSPSSEDGCVIFVKLRQYPGNRPTIRIAAEDFHWTDVADGIKESVLFNMDQFIDSAKLVSVEKNSVLSLTAPTGGLEAFVVSGNGEIDEDPYSKYEWIRIPESSTLNLKAGSDSVVYIKTGHFDLIL